jgi:catechol 2,3-dioxygenase-like lactoylglutathione lyase family enzyme
MIQGISHITFIVSDLDRMTDLLETVFGAEEVYSSGEKTFSISKEKFFLINGLWIAIMEGMPLLERTYNHVAFQIRDEDLDEIALRIKGLGLEVREARDRIEGEGQSLYFYDFDNHLFELHTGTLDQRIQTYSQANKMMSQRSRR